MDAMTNLWLPFVDGEAQSLAIYGELDLVSYAYERTGLRVMPDGVCKPNTSVMFLFYGLHYKSNLNYPANFLTDGKKWCPVSWVADYWDGIRCIDKRLNMLRSYPLRHTGVRWTGESLTKGDQKYLMSRIREFSNSVS